MTTRAGQTASRLSAADPEFAEAPSTTAPRGNRTSYDYHHALSLSRPPPRRPREPELPATIDAVASGPYPPSAESELVLGVVEQLALANSSPMPQVRFQLLQQWEGTVVEVGEDTFDAVLQDLTDPTTPEESVELYLEDVDEADRALLEPGAIFYWSIGYEEGSRGLARKSVVRFRRLPGWTKRRLNEVQVKTGQLVSYFLEPEQPVSRAAPSPQ
jgi:hypothetical protein